MGDSRAIVAQRVDPAEQQEQQQQLPQPEGQGNGGVAGNGGGQGQVVMLKALPLSDDQTPYRKVGFYCFGLDWVRSNDVGIHTCLLTQ